MISNFVQLPTSLLQDRVIPLLEIVDLVRLDTAVLNHIVRFQFLELLRGAKLMTESLPVDNQVAQWLLHRKIRITDLQVHIKVKDLSIVKQLVPFVGTGVSLDSRSIVNIKAAKDFVRACKSIKSLRLKLYTKQTKSVLESVSQHCTALHTIHLQGSWDIGIDQFTALTAGCRMLTEFNIDHFSCLDDDYVSTIAQNCPQLQKLSMNHCNQCRDRSLQALAQHCRDLRYLGISNLPFVTGEGVGALAACSELRTVLLCYNLDITSDGIIALAQGCTKLEEIDIPEMDENFDLAVATLVQHCPALNNLRSLSAEITDKSLQYLQNCPHLHTLEFPRSNTSIGGLVKILDCCTYLRRLDIRLQPPFHEVPGVSGGFQRLEYIGFVRCTSLTDAAFIPMIVQCLNITELSLTLCAGLTDGSVLAIAAHCRKLKDISISDNSLISDAAVAVLAQSCSQLSYISLDCLSLLTDATVSAIAQHCPYLEHLDMSDCSAVTDESIIEILQKCRKIREIVLFRCSSIITSNVLGAAVLYRARLCHLDLSLCVLPNKTAVQTFRTAKPNCKLLGV